MVVWGDVNLTPEEMSLLRLGPGYMVVAPLNSEEQRVEENMTMTKIRWTKKKNGTEEMSGHQEDEEESERDSQELEAMELQDRIELEARDVMDPDGSGIDMRRKRATDMRGNRSVYMPAPSTPLVEA